MDAGKHTIKELFQLDVRYFIPTFQRPYVWNQERQWEPLWSDVRNLAEHLAETLEETNGNHALAEETVGTHFLGAIVLQQVHTPTAEIDRRDVIDGQQRMTTLQILLDAAQEVLENEGFRKEAKRLQKLVLNDEDFAEGDAQFKLWPTSSDQDAFRAAMTNGQETSDFEQSLIVQAHEFFSLQITEWLHRIPIEERKQLADALHTVLLGLLVLVVIDLKTGDDAYVIFETLNARGTPLLASDLVKNYILQNANAKGFNTDDIYQKYWVGFEDDWWRKDIRQGRLVRPRIDIFLNYWLIARQRAEVPSHNVFPVFRKYVTKSLADEKTPQNIEGIANNIQQYGSTYRKLEDYSEKSEEGTFLYRWNLVQAGVVTPVLLQLFSADLNQLTRERKLRCLRALESFLIRRMLCRMTTKDYNRLFLELLTDLDGNIDHADEIIINYLAGQTAESREWPNDERLIDALLDLPLYRLLTRTRLRMVLESLEEAMRTDRAEVRHVVRGSLTIEHILPQKWSAHWPLEVVDDPEEYHRRIGSRERIKHTIGNLTLVTGKLNPTLSNGPWEKKQQVFQEHSTLYLNKRLLSNWGGAPFSEPDIKARGMELARLASRVWLGPEKL